MDALVHLSHGFTAKKNHASFRLYEKNTMPRKSYTITDVRDYALDLYLQAKPNGSHTYSYADIAELTFRRFRRQLPIANLKKVSKAVIGKWVDEFGWHKVWEESKAKGIESAFNDFYAKGGNKTVFEKEAEVEVVDEKKVEEGVVLKSMQEQQEENKKTLLKSFGVIPENIRKIEDNLRNLELNMDNRTNAYLMMWRPLYMSILSDCGILNDPAYQMPRKFAEMPFERKLIAFQMINQNLRDDENIAMSRMQRKLTEAKGKYGYTNLTVEQLDLILFGSVKHTVERRLRPKELGGGKGTEKYVNDVQGTRKGGDVQQGKSDVDGAIDALDEFIGTMESHVVKHGGRQDSGE